MNTKSRGLIIFFFSFLLIFSTQLFAAPWEPLTNLSGWIMGETIPLSLNMNNNGDQAAFFMTTEKVGFRILATIKYKGHPWGEAVDLTGPSSFPLYMPSSSKGLIAPDGTAWMVWIDKNDSQPTHKYKIVVACCPPGGDWRYENISNWEGFISSVDISIGINGDIAIAWVSFDNLPSNMTQGPSSVKASRRPSATGIFSPPHIIASDPSVGFSRVFNMVGSTGLTVVIYGRAITAGGTQWRLQSHTYLPETGTWDNSATDISGIIDTNSSRYWCSEPVMSKDNTVITAWTALTAIGGNREAQYSSTRNPTTGNWSSPTKLSGDADALSIPLLSTKDGTTAAVWTEDKVSQNVSRICGTARDPGGVWQTSNQLSGWHTDISIQDLDIWPTDGTIMALWEIEDDSRAANDDKGLFWSARTPTNTWGSGGSGQLDTWFDDLNGAGLVMGTDGTATIVYSVVDTKQPTQLPGEVRQIKWPSGGPWDTPEIIADSFALAALHRRAVASTISGKPVSAVWTELKSKTPPYFAVWHSQTSAPYNYYIPVFKPAPGHWSGLGITNLSSTNAAEVTITIFEQNGAVLTTQANTIPALGQDALTVGAGVTSNGWIEVTSNQPLAGLNFLGEYKYTNTDYFMGDVPFTQTLSNSLLIPHVAQNDIWDTTIYTSNPNTLDSTVDFIYTNKAGIASVPYTAIIPANGSKEISVADIAGSTNISGGYVTISSTHGLAAFALYNNLKTGNYSYAGINAVDTSIVSPLTDYYIPLFKPAPEYWSGLGITNLSSANSANVTVTVFSPDGLTSITETKSIVAKGQDAFVVGEGFRNGGWIKISTDQPLAGLNFLGEYTDTSNNYFLGDVPFTQTLSNSLLIPHVAQNDIWDTTIFLANPFALPTSVTLIYTDKSGAPSTPYTVVIPAKGSREIPLSTIAGSTNISGGYVTISSTNGLTAFALYNNLKTDNYSYAGINAVDISK